MLDRLIRTEAFGSGYPARADPFEKQLTLSAPTRTINAGNGVSLKMHDR
jgi:hypothetical protein